MGSIYDKGKAQLTAGKEKDPASVVLPPEPTWGPDADTGEDRTPRQNGPADTPGYEPFAVNVDPEYGGEDGSQTKSGHGNGSDVSQLGDTKSSDGDDARSGGAERDYDPAGPHHVNLSALTAVAFTVAPSEAVGSVALSHYERIIGENRRLVEQALLEVHHHWVLTAGQALQQIRDLELYKVRGFGTFDEYTSKIWDMRRAHAYRLIDSVAPALALVAVTQQPPNERQLRALVPVAKNHGDEAVREVWEETDRRGRISGATLEQVAREKKYMGGAVEEVVPPEFQTAQAALDRAWRGFTLENVRRVAAERPDEARDMVMRLRRRADEIEQALG